MAVSSVPKRAAHPAPARTRPLERPSRGFVRDWMVPLIPFVLGWIATVALFYPAHANGDTAGPYLYALGRLPIDDWHPTANVVLNWFLLTIWESPASIVAFQSGLVWLGFGVIASTLRRVYRVRTAPYFVIAGFTPVVFAFLGTLIKDTYSVGFTVAAIALLVVERTVTRRRWLYLAGAAIALVPAYLVKLPAMPIVVALLVYIVLRLRVHRGPWSAVLVGAATVFVSVPVLVGAQRLTDEATGARRVHVESALQLYDLAGITHFTGENVLGEAVLPSDRLDEVTDGACYDPRGWDVLAWGQCSFVNANAAPIWGTDELSDRWMDAIRAHPWAYVRHRAEHLWTFSVVTGRYGFYYDYVDGRLDWKPGHNWVMDAYDGVIGATETWPFMRPIFWQAASLTLLVVTLWRRRSGTTGLFDPLITATAIGNLLFYVQWAVIGVSDEFRYSYTIVVTSVICSIILVVERRSASRPGPLSESDGDGAPPSTQHGDLAVRTPELSRTAAGRAPLRDDDTTDR
jgi:hypothetical protein